MPTIEECITEDLSVLRTLMPEEEFRAWFESVAPDDMVEDPGNMFEISGPGALDILLHVWKPSGRVRLGMKILEKLEELNPWPLIRNVKKSYNL